MYCEFFGFRERPFTVTPNPRFIYLSKNHKEVFAHLFYGIRSHCGFIEVTGEVGTGKTTVLRTLLGQLEDDAFRSAFIFNPGPSAAELLRCIHREFGLGDGAATIDELLASLYAFLLQENAAGRTVVLVIDEAQSLEAKVLEQIRLLSNLETEADKLIQIVLVGQPELGRMLAQPELRQLNQRISVRYHLRPMDFTDSRDYIRHRLQVAGGRGDLFTPRSLRKIHRAADGLPRLINVLCDRALLSAYAEDRRAICGRIVTGVINELRRREAKRSPWLRLTTTIGPLLAVFLLGPVVAEAPRWNASPATFLPLPTPDAAAPSAAPSEKIPEISPARPDPDRPSISDEDSVYTAADLQARLTSIDEERSTVLAFNALAPLWGAAVERKKRLSIPFGLQNACDVRGLRLSGFSGPLDELLRLDVPALMKIRLPADAGFRYVTLLRVREGRLAVTPGLPDGAWLERETLERLWTGRAYLVWRDYRDIPLRLSPGDRGEGVRRLQELLQVAGFLGGKASSSYDAATVAAIKRFQAGEGLRVDGLAGPRTLISLYRQATVHSLPALQAGPTGDGK